MTSIIEFRSQEMKLELLVPILEISVCAKEAIRSKLILVCVYLLFVDMRSISDSTHYFVSLTASIFCHSPSVRSIDTVFMEP